MVAVIVMLPLVAPQSVMGVAVLAVMMGCTGLVSTVLAVEVQALPTTRATSWYVPDERFEKILEV